MQKWERVCLTRHCAVDQSGIATLSISLYRRVLVAARKGAITSTPTRICETRHVATSCASWEGLFLASVADWKVPLQ